MCYVLCVCVCLCVLYRHPEIQEICVQEVINILINKIIY